jgi:chemotaxis protein MotA
MIQVFKGTPFNKATYVDLFKLLYALARLARRDGPIALDAHVSAPGESPLFQQYPKFSNNHHARDFLCNALATVMDGKADPVQLTAALEEEIAVIEREHHAAVAALAKTADALPGFGIVAAVLGIVVTMQAIGGPAEEIGHKVGAALVGTFLGILLSYGIFAPMATRLEFMGEQELIFFRAMAGAVVAINEGASPADVVQRARRAVGTESRPSPEEMKQILSEVTA